MAKIEEEELESLDDVYSEIMDVKLQMSFLSNRLDGLVKVLRNRPLVRRAIVCGYCNHREWNYNIQLSNPQFNIVCEICGKEGCEYCTDYYIRKGIKHFYHKSCSRRIEVIKE